VAPPVILASGSRVRANMLAAAGVPFTVETAGVDEDEVKGSLKAAGADAEEVAMALAELKAVRVSARHAGALVIGADQMLDCAGRWFDKPADMAHARAHLQALRGKTHELITAACVAHNGGGIWRQVERVRLRMLAFSDACLDAYLAAAGEDVLDSVGAYRIEGLGVQLFARVDGSHFTIMGLPLLGLLAFLREHEVLST
jgi:septum formation protein